MGNVGFGLDQNSLRLRISAPPRVSDPPVAGVCMAGRAGAQRSCRAVELKHRAHRGLQRPQRGAVALHRAASARRGSHYTVGGPAS